MGFFGKSEAELKQIATDLDKRQTDLDNRESSIASKEATLAHERELLTADKHLFDAERAKHVVEVNQVADRIASEKADLEKRRSEIALLEAKAKANFAETQREAFREVFDKRQSELDARQMALDSLASDVAGKMEALHAKEADVATRQLAVTEREQKADNGFADKAKSLADEAARQYQANRAESERLRALATELASDREAFEEQKAALVQRELAIQIAEQKRDNGFADQRASMEAELREKRAQMESEIAVVRSTRLSALEDEIAKLRTARLDEVSRSEQAERDRVCAEIANDREAWSKQQEEVRKQIASERAELEKQKGATFALQSELERRKSELEAAERMLERKEQRMEQQWQKRHDELEECVETRLHERRASMELTESASKEEIARLRDSIRNQTELLGAFEHLKRQLGDKDPAEMLRDLNSQTDELKRLREELATRPSEEMRERYQSLESEAKIQKARADELAKQLSSQETDIAEVGNLRHKNSELLAENKSLSQKAAIFEGAANEATEQLARLRAAYERPAEVDARYKEIEAPHIQMGKAMQATKADVDEIEWLKSIGDACDRYGLHFNPRILKAFHTALKTAEWSPLTVLAGVSGTGKSELPRLYSHFGGLMFEPLSVQPNWDSQESMLGFFNSIDNKFDAQPLLRFLAQSQKEWRNGGGDDDGYPGLRDAVCLVLLDEMNLAHPELYFAEFLSKLELRRGMKGSDVPSLPVKIGAGMPPYPLPLGRNVLWTGTMNQDETTKSLSDKVLDRSIIIHFPRPSALKRRLKLMPLDEKNRGSLLHRMSWQSWLAQGSSFSEDDVKPFMEFIEKMNAALAVAGRAIGHRVWQSIEYYMANYPDVRAAQKSQDKDQLAKALHTAFEDQLVQKVMPKLRGIDTRGKSKTDCLDKILAQVNTGIGGNPFGLAEDFNLACELGYGQFIWQSANYLKEEFINAPVSDMKAQQVEASIVTDGTVTASPVVSSQKEAPLAKFVNEDLTTPPPNFMPNDPDRDLKWSQTNDKQKRIWKQSRQ